MNYYLIEQSGRRWITTDTEQFGGDTQATLIQSLPSIEILSESVLSASNDQINQLSEQLQQKNFAA